MNSDEKAAAIANDLTILAILDALPPHSGRNVAVRLARCIDGIDELHTGDDVRRALRRHLETRISYIETRFTK